MPKKAKTTPQEQRAQLDEAMTKVRAERELQVAGSFSLDPTELAASREFIKDHACTLTPLNRGIYYRFCDAGVGTNIHIQCSCGADKDISNYDCW